MSLLYIAPKGANLGFITVTHVHLMDTNEAVSLAQITALCEQCQRAMSQEPGLFRNIHLTLRVNLVRLNSMLRKNVA